MCVYIYKSLCTIFLTSKKVFKVYTNKKATQLINHKIFEGFFLYFNFHKPIFYRINCQHYPPNLSRGRTPNNPYLFLNTKIHLI